MKINQIAVQGDVLIRRVKSIPPHGKRRENGVLVYGESTGHAHRVGVLEAAEILECGDGLFLSVGENGVSIVHEEHAPVVLDPGNYEIIRQREYSPEAIRNVMD